MPQMMPLNWILLFIFFNLFYYMFMQINYFNFKFNYNNNQNSKKLLNDTKFIYNFWSFN